MPTSRPTVFFEATVVGQARQNRLARTGIYRVNVELLLELTRSHPDLVVIPFSRSPEAAEDLLAALNELGLPLGLAPQQAWSARLLKILFPNWLAKTRLGPLLTKIKKVIYELNLKLAIRATRVKPILQDTFLKTHLHAVCHRVVIAYDLIPVLHLGWCQNGMFSQFDHFYSSIQAEDTVVCISTATRADLLRCYTQINPEQCVVVPLAASEQFRPERDQQVIAQLKKRIGIGAFQPYFLALCTLEPRKNLRAVIDAFAQLQDHADSNLTPHLVITGQPGWGDQSELIQAAKTLDIQDRLVLTGYLADADLPALYSGAIAFVYPSLYEGFGLPVLEAMQCGTPVITSQSSSLPEVVREAGILVDPTDTASITAAMAMLLKSEDMQKRLSSQAIARASQFSWKTAASQIAARYRTIYLNAQSTSS